MDRANEMKSVYIPSCAAWINSHKSNRQGHTGGRLCFISWSKTQKNSLPSNTAEGMRIVLTHYLKTVKKLSFDFHFLKHLMFPSLRSLRSSASISHIWTKQKLSLLRHLFIRVFGFVGFFLIAGLREETFQLHFHPATFFGIKLRPEHHTRARIYTYEFSSLYF